MVTPYMMEVKRFTIRDSLSGQTISFALSTETVGPGGDYTSGEGLTMNKLNGTSPSANVDANDGAGEVNVLAIEPRVWNNFWITIEEDINGTGTHKADVYLNGSNTPPVIFLRLEMVTMPLTHTSQYY